MCWANEQLHDFLSVTHKSQNLQEVFAYEKNI